MAAAVAAVGEAAAAKKRGASRSWILIDASGDERVLDADKYAIMHRVDINARDLRILDPLLSYPSTILGRERAIVLNLEVSHAPSFTPPQVPRLFFCRGGIIYCSDIP
jgi:magnesium transporter